MRKPILAMLFVVLLALTAACGNDAMPGEVTAAALPDPGIDVAEPQGRARIEGTVAGFAPPTPPVAVFALEVNTNAWFMVELPETPDGPTPFNIEVTPGTYVVFACALNADTCGFGYSTNSMDLAELTLNDGQAAIQVSVGPRPNSECGLMLYLPPSPDGRFAAAEVDQGCLATLAEEIAEGLPGTISGTAYLLAPPTPNLYIYAHDTATGNWGVAFAEANPDGPAAFSIDLPAGDYVVYGCLETGTACSLGYTTNSFDLAPVALGAGEVVAGIAVGPSPMSDCGPMLAVPGAPDGTYGPAEIDEDCLATLRAALQP